LAEEVSTLFFKLVLLKMSISIWSDCHSIRTGLEPDSVFNLVVRRHPMWLSEKPVELL